MIALRFDNRARGDPVITPFSTLKTAQAAAVLLKAEHAKSMGRMRLLKLLYIADRALIAERGRPITGDRPVAMKLGPVLSETYGLIKGQHTNNCVWDQFFQSDGYRVVLIHEPGNGELSQREIGQLQKVADLYREVEDFDLSDLTHLLPEWAKNRPAGNGQNPIPLDDLLEATGRLADKESILRLERTERAAKALFAGK